VLNELAHFIIDAGNIVLGPQLVGYGQNVYLQGERCLCRSDLAPGLSKQSLLKHNKYICILSIAVMT
jgi:hypothetical protein